MDLGDFNPCEELIPAIVDHHGASCPDRIYAEYPNTNVTYDQGYFKITYGDLANAVNGAAWFLTKTLGPGDNKEVLPYIGPNDLRYSVLVAGALKAGYVVQMFYTSPRNSIVAHQNLLETLKCKHFLSSTPWPSAVTTIANAVNVKIVGIPSVDELLKIEYPVFPFVKTLTTNGSENLFIVHTSGSTGIPKPIYFTNEAAARSIRMIRMDPPKSFDGLYPMTLGKRFFITFPPFHVTYLICNVFNSIPFGTVMVAPISATIISARGIVEGIKQTPVDGAFAIPSIVQELAQDPELLEFCAKNLDIIVYGGGDLPQDIGDRVASKVKLVNQYGASELGLIPMLFSKSNRDPMDWKYIEIHPAMGIEFRHVTDSQHELVIVRNADLEENQPTFSYGGGFTELQEYSSRDLFIPHPDPNKKNFWKWHARKDDIIVFLNGEKTNPISMEQQILSHNPQVTGVLVVGAQRFQAALLVEADTGGKELSPSDRASLLEAIWPSVEGANKVCPAYARIAKSHVLFTHPDKPMLRSGKGTVQRSGTITLYEEETDKLYIEAEAVSTQPGGYVGPGKNADRGAVSKYIKSSAVAATEWPDLGDNDNMFIRGMDSLQTITIVRTLRHGLDMSDIDVPLIYAKPSITELADAIMQLKENATVSNKLDIENQLRERQEMFKVFQEKIDRIPSPSSPAVPGRRHNVILTGSTGVLGTYLLHDLLNDHSVEHVYCLNRRDNSRSAQICSYRTRHLEADFDESRVTFLKVDMSKEDFDLSADMLQKLRDTTTVVLHNAWPVNFNLSMRSFEPQLAGVVHLISFCASARSHPRLLFMSSTSSVVAHRTKSGINSEKVIITETPAPNGYAESKYLAEVLLDYASKRLPIPLSFARIGQVAGAVKKTGLWNPAEWFPSLVLSSLHIGALPESLGPSMGRIDWVPADLLSEVLIELVLSPFSESETRPVEVFHPLNLHPQTWTSILPTIVEEIAAVTDKTLAIVPLSNWIARIRQDMEAKGRVKSGGSENLETLLKANPAAKLLHFYEGLDAQDKTQNPEDGLLPRLPNVLDASHAAKKSDTLRAIPAIKGSWFAKWIAEWMEQ
ncbi:NRPS-like enzyme [Penicillium canescens]|nr:NRPS-like enzyme [Penicillium canescens]KAJ6176304.1 NRPS-like enzyme [Penicillium canescens]